VLAGYADYQCERATLTGDDGTDLVLVNLYHEPLGAPMSYRAAKGFFDRLARECGFPVRPHMLRHSAATNWVRAGVDLDVVQALLGHASLASTTVYLHARDEDKRRAVEVVASGGRYR
jgi:site-specific recombinase XerD